MRVVKPPTGSNKQMSIVAEWRYGNKAKLKELKLVNIKLAEPDTVGPSSHVTSSPGNHRLPVQQSARETETLFPREARNVDQGRTAAPHDVTASAANSATCHGLEWTQSDISVPLNGPAPRRQWSVLNVAGQCIADGQGVPHLSPFDFFMYMFPMSHLSQIVALTNLELQRRDKQLTTSGEILRYFGVLVLMSRFEFGPRRELWQTTSQNKYVPVPNFTRIIPYHRFEMLRMCIRYSHSGGTGDVDGDNRWSLVDDFVTAINLHREMYVTPSELICVDESMSRWYGLGGDWLDVGLPTYRAIDRKPENGCEIKTSACGRSGILLRMEIVKSPDEDAQQSRLSSVSHGTAVTMRLVHPWLHTNRIVCGDSYFASVETAETLFASKTRFIGVVKTAHRGFPLAHMGSQPMSGRGTWYSMVHKNVEKEYSIGSVMWIDRERRHFVATAGCTLPGATIYRERWRRDGNVSRRIMTETAVPQIAETYYNAASQIDRHNRCRQDELKLEKKFRVKEWSQRVNTSLLAVCIVDAWLLYKGNRGSRGCMSPNAFYSMLAEQLIDNNYTSTATRASTARPVRDDVTASGIGPHLTPTNRKRKRQDGTLTGCAFQGKCKSCKSGKKTKYVCSECTRTTGKDFWVCHSDTGRKCFTDHLACHHVDH